MTAQPNAPQRLLALADQTEILVDLLTPVAPQDPALADLAHRLVDIADALRAAAKQRAAITRALDMAESLRRCTGATAVTVHDSGVSATSTGGGK